MLVTKTQGGPPLYIPGPRQCHPGCPSPHEVQGLTVTPYPQWKTHCNISLPQEVGDSTLPNSLLDSLQHDPGLNLALISTLLLHLLSLSGLLISILPLHPWAGLGVKAYPLGKQGSADEMRRAQTGRRRGWGKCKVWRKSQKSRLAPGPESQGCWVGCVLRWSRKGEPGLGWSLKKKRGSQYPRG